MSKRKKKIKAIKPYKVVTGDILDWCKTYTGPKYHAMLCDPPYSIGFMGKKWDSQDNVVNRKETWEALMDHLHPGAFCFAFSSTRTLHRMMVAIEDAGFVIHPFMALWNFSNGFPKATNPSYQIDKLEGAEREIVGKSNSGMVRVNKRNAEHGYRKSNYEEAHHSNITASGSKLGKLWDGHRYGLQALKPAFEPIICFQKPYPKKTKPVVSMLETGAGALNINNARIGYESGGSVATNPSLRSSIKGGNGGHVISTEKESRIVIPNTSGRWPSNLILSHLPECKCSGNAVINAGAKVNKHRDGEATKASKKRKLKFGMKPGARRGGEESVTTWKCVEGCPVLELGTQSGDRKVATSSSNSRKSSSLLRPNQGAYQKQGFLHQDSGTAARYYFQASWDYNVQERIENAVLVRHVTKPSKKEKDAGLKGRNTHVTIKPLRIAEYLAKLLLPPKNFKRRLLVPFAGSGSEMIGARLAGWDRVVGIELVKEHSIIAKKRLKYWESRRLHPKMFEGELKPKSSKGN